MGYRFFKLNPIHGLVQVLVFMLATQAGARGGSEVGNGAGYSEQLFVYSISQLETYLEMVSTSQYLFDQEEKALMPKLIRELRFHPKLQDLIEFRSEKKEPGFFVIDGLVRVAKTGSNPNDLIYVNVDMLYAKSPIDGRMMPTVDLRFAITTLLHELGHHHGIMDHKKLDDFGNKVAAIAKTNQQSIGLPGKFQWMSLQAINFDLPSAGSPYGDVLIDDTLQLYNIGKEVYSRNPCPPQMPVALNAKLSNLHWVRPGIQVKEGEGMQISFQGNAAYTCGARNPGTKPPLEIKQRYQLRSKLSFKYRAFEYVETWNFEDVSTELLDCESSSENRCH